MAPKGNLKRVLRGTVLGITLSLAALIAAPAAASATEASHTASVEATSLDHAATATTGTPVSTGTMTTDVSTDDYTIMAYWEFHGYYGTQSQCRNEGALRVQYLNALDYRCDHVNLGHFLAWALYLRFR